MPMSSTRSIFQISWRGIYSRFFIHLILFCAITSLIEGRPKTLKKCGRRNSQTGRIVGGTTAQAGEQPWIVSIHEKQQYQYKHICGGTILNEYYIVTAAHCIDSPKSPWKYQIYVGLHQLSKKHREPAKMYKISHLTVHEDYDGEMIVNDIALLRTKDPIRFERSARFVNGICLPYTNKDPSGWGLVAGWGFVEEGSGSASDTLEVVKVPLVSRKLCTLAYEELSEESDGSGDSDYSYSASQNYTIFDSQICAGIAERDSCQGDSGGPFIQRNKKGIHTLIGVVSYGEGCARRKYPGVYTKVAFYMDWLENNMS